MNVSIERFGESAVVLSVDAPRGSIEVQRRLWAVERASREWEGVVDAVCGDGNVTVFADADLADFARLTEWLQQAWDASQGEDAVLESRCVEIPVAYGGVHGPDLDEVARQCNLRVDDVIELHASGEYVVLFVGFLPGFAYLGGLDARLAVPRRSEPRTAVEAGSVGIGGAVTGVYPFRSPGGWNVIGRTDVAMFDARRVPAALCAPGDRVRFVPLVGAGAR